MARSLYLTLYAGDTHVSAFVSYGCPPYHGNTVNLVNPSGVLTPTAGGPSDCGLDVDHYEPPWEGTATFGGGDCAHDVTVKIWFQGVSQPGGAGTTCYYTFIGCITGMYSGQFSFRLRDFEFPVPFLVDSAGFTPFPFAVLPYSRANFIGIGSDTCCIDPDNPDAISQEQFNFVISETAP